MSTMREMSLEEVANQYGGTHRAAKEYNALRARVAELQPMAECAAIMAVCGYFSRMRGPDAFVSAAVMDQLPRSGFMEAWIADRPTLMKSPIPLYAGSAPVPAAQAEAKVPE